MARTFAEVHFDDPDFVASKHLVTSVRVETVGGHDLVSVWNRGGKSGTLTVDAGDGERIAKRLLGGVWKEVE